jgi:hypothetical protein
VKRLETQLEELASDLQLSQASEVVLQQQLNKLQAQLRCAEKSLREAIGAGEQR